MGAIPYFIMRSDPGANATWASIQMGNQWWDDHQHYAAGHLVLARGSDYLLVSATDWKSAQDGDGNPIHGGSGVLGGSLEANESSLANTLYFDDFGDFQSTDELANGGQYAVGVDQVVADELSQDFSYVRSDLSSAYNRAGDPSDAPNRRLDFFYRSFRLPARAEPVRRLRPGAGQDLGESQGPVPEAHPLAHAPPTPSSSGSGRNSTTANRACSSTWSCRRTRASRWSTNWPTPIPATVPTSAACRSGRPTRAPTGSRCGIRRTRSQSRS
jgi:hypothetical protein